MDYMRIIIAVLLFSGICFILGLLIGIFHKVFYVEEDLRLKEIMSLLPGINCGSCGESGCAKMAMLIKEKKVSPTSCRPNSLENTNKIKQLLEEEN